MPQRRFAEAEAMMREFGRQDPGNGRVPSFIAQIEGLDRLFRRMDELEKGIREGKLDINNALELASVYLQASQIPKFMALAGSIAGNTALPNMYHFRIAQLYERASKWNEMVGTLDSFLQRLTPDTPPGALLDVTKMYAKANRMDRMVATMQEYLRRKPDDWRGWLDLAAMELGMKRTEAASRALDQAVRHGGREAMGIIQGDQRFAPIRNRAVPRGNLLGVPGGPTPNPL